MFIRNSFLVAVAALGLGIVFHEVIQTTNAIDQTEVALNDNQALSNQLSEAIAKADAASEATDATATGNAAAAPTATANAGE